MALFPIARRQESGLIIWMIFANRRNGMKRQKRIRPEAVMGVDSFPGAVKAFDIETASSGNYTDGGALNPYGDSWIFAYCIGHELDNIEVIRAGRDPYWTNPHNICPRLQSFLDDTSIAKICHNVKFEYSFLVTQGYRIPDNTVWHDTMIMSQFVRNLAQNHQLEYLVWELGGDPNGEMVALDEKVKRMARAYNGFDKVPEPLMNRYQRTDGQCTLMLYEAFLPFLRENEDQWIDYRNDIALALVTQRMEMRGFMLDREGCDNILQHCDKGVKDVYSQLKTVGKPNEFYNLASPKDIIRLLYNEQKLKPPFFTKTGQPSTDKDAMSILREQYGDHPALSIVQRFRSYMKGDGTIRKYFELADSNDVIHPNIKTNHAVTGREACDNPNLQNVSKPENAKNEFIVSTRPGFRARQGYKLLNIDQSGIELRLIIEAAGSDKMRELMLGGKHPHVHACELFYKDIYETDNGLKIVTPPLAPPPSYKPYWIGKKESKPRYDAGKNGHFCLGYGGGLETFAETINMPIPLAEPGYNRYCLEFPEIVNCATDGARKVMTTGYIITPFGRQLAIPSGKFYAWLNYYIQGTAAGIIKRGQVAVDEYIRKYWSGLIYMILTVHDSIMFEVEEETWEKYGPVLYRDISRLMISIEHIMVPLEVEWEISDRCWSDAKPFRM